MKRSVYREFLGMLGIFSLLQCLFALLVDIRPQQNFLTENSLHSQLNQSTQSKEKRELHWLCSKILHDGPPGGFAGVWKTIQPLVLEGLLHPRDGAHIHANWTRDLLEHLLTPHVLEYSIKGTPQSSVIQSIAAKLGQRLRNPSLSKEPLKIVVFGGSVVEGIGCMRSPISGGNLDFPSLRECAWPFRLEIAMNHILGRLLGGGTTNTSFIQVYNLATGGTNSESAIPVLQYGLGPALRPESPADIIVNAYSANDNLPPAFHGTTNTTIDSFHMARIWKRNIEFVNAAQSSQQCRSDPPFILFVNDYLGNQQESIVGESQLDQVIQWIADFDASVGYVSVSHSVRRWLLADTSEDFFSGQWVDRKGLLSINVHFGQAGHVATTIAVLYYLCKTLYEYCEVDDDVYYPTSAIIRHGHDFVDIQIPTKEWVQIHKPPIIRPNLSEAHWNLHLVPPKEPSTCQSTPPCVFAFLAAQLGTHRRQDLLAEFLKGFAIYNDGWEAQNDYRHGGFQNKLGLVALKAGASMTLAYPDSSQIRVLTMHYLKSYGDLWNESTLELRAQVLSGVGEVAYEQVMQVEGFHEQSVSIAYTFGMAFTPPKDGEFRLHLTLIGGNMFKINALMFCRESATIRRP